MSFANGKTAVITGAGSGIGRALAIQLNREGCELYISDIHEDGLTETAALLPRQDIAAHARLLDVADRQAMHSWAREVADQGASVDIVVNNAGVGYGATVSDSEYEHLDWLININLWGVIHGTKAFLPLLLKAKRGHLVNISSVLGFIGMPTQSAYCAAKFAVRGFTESLRHELKGSNVHVCCVHPGGVLTNIARTSRGSDPAITAEERHEMFSKIARTSPESAANQIIRAMERRNKRLLIGLDAWYLSLLYRLFPVNYLRFVPGVRDIEYAAE